MKQKDEALEAFLAIKNQTATTAELYFYGDIVSNWWGAWDKADQYPDAVKNFLSSAQGKDLDIYINSGGGAVFAGMAIYNMLKRHDGFKTVHVDGLAASIASIIALAGDRIIIPENAYFMVHRPWTYTAGNAETLRSQAEVLDTLDKGMMSVYLENSKISEEDLRQYVEEEKWFTGQEAAEVFKNMETDAPVETVACLRYAGTRAPQAIRNKKEALAEEERLRLLILKGDKGYGI